MSTPRGTVPRDLCDERHRLEGLAFAEYRVAMDERFRAADVARERALDALERRLSLLNEFRAQAEDQAAEYAKKETVDLVSSGFDLRLRAMERIQATSEGSQRVWAVVAGAVTGLVSSVVVGILLKLIA